MLSSPALSLNGSVLNDRKTMTHSRLLIDLDPFSKMNIFYFHRFIVNRIIIDLKFEGCTSDGMAPGAVFDSSECSTKFCYEVFDF